MFRPCGKGNLKGHTLDVTSGEWSCLADMPECMSVRRQNDKDIAYLVQSRTDTEDESFVFMRGHEAWARLLPDGQWEVNPDLTGYDGANMLELYEEVCQEGDERNLKFVMKIFTGICGERFLFPDWVMVKSMEHGI